MRKKTDKNNYLNPRAQFIIDKLAVDGASDEETEDEEINIVEPGSSEELEGILEAKLTVKAMYISVGILSALLALAGCIFIDERLSFLAGCLAGVVSDCLYIFNLNNSLKDVLNMDSESAIKQSKRDSVIRLSIIAVVAIAVSVLVAGNAPLGILLGLLALKLGLYLTPAVMNKLRKKTSN